MKTNYLLFTLLILLLYSCDKDKDKDEQAKTEVDNIYVNRWVAEQMSMVYYWNEEIPKVYQKSLELDPKEFFETLLYKRGKVEGDRFSWIQNDYEELLNSLRGVTPYDIGFEYVFYSVEGKQEIIGQVVYIKPNTDAESQGVKRGDIFRYVDGQAITDDNYHKLFRSSVADVTFVNNYGANGEEEKVKSLNLAARYAEDPIYLEKIYLEGPHKVGYLVYNIFTPDNGDGSKKYDLKLNDVIGGFKASGVTHLVLDLRYNSGGLMLTATHLGSMLVPQLDANNIFTKLKYNKSLMTEFIKAGEEAELSDKFREYIEIDKTKKVAINNIGDQLQKLYILTSGSTASASELVINNLRPYMGDKIVLIGSNTAGKNLGSITLFKENDKRNKWGIQPIVLKYANKDDFADFITGLVPVYKEKDNNLNKLDLGDRDEAMLRIALSLINGTYVEKRSQEEGLKAVGSSVSNKPWSNHVTVELDKLKLIKE